MTTLDEVVAILRTAQQRVEDAITMSGQARRELAKAETRLCAVTQGSGRAESRAAVRRWATARDHLDRMIPRLILGNEALDAYLAHVAPGPPQRGEAAFRSGEELVDESERRDRSIGSLIRTAVKKADEIQDSGTDLGTAVGRGFRMTIKPKDGGHAPALGQPTAPVAGTQQTAGVKLDPGDIVGNSIVAAIGIAAVSHQTAQKARKAFRRRRHGK